MEAAKAREVARQIADSRGVKMADACWGSRDIFAVIEVKESQELNKLVMDKIQRLNGLEKRAHTSPLSSCGRTHGAPDWTVSVVYDELFFTRRLPVVHCLKNTIASEFAVTANPATQFQAITEWRRSSAAIASEEEG